MKLKLVVASMSVLGLISCPVLATAKVKHKHHHKVSHHQMATTPDMNAGPVPVVTTTPVVDMSQMIYDSMGQNLGRSIHATPDWFQRIAVIGGINVDAHWFNRSMGYNGENNRRLSLNDAYLNVTALVNCWTKAFLSVSYNNATGIDGTTVDLSNQAFEVQNSVKHGVYSFAYTPNRVMFEQAYVTFGNFCCSPFFVQLGKQFTDFGRYTIHPIERTMTQVLSESLQTSAKVGFITPMGFHGQVYVFDNSLIKVGESRTGTIWGAALGYDHPDAQLGYDVGVGYMSNMTGVNDVAYSIANYEIRAAGAPNTPGTYGRTVAAWNVYGDVNSGPFSFSARYTTAARHFDPATLSDFFLTTTGGYARPWAYDLTAAYAFNAWCKDQMVYVGYQRSGDAVNLLVPQQRMLAGYSIEVMHNTTLAAEYGYDKDYGRGHGGTGRNTSTLGARAAVKFG